jgi:DNA-binding NtrC family response regulator
VRQLRNVLERALIVAGQGTILPKHLPADPSVPGNSPTVPQAADEECIRIRVGSQLSEVEEAYIDLVLKHTNNNKTRAAEILGLSLRTLHNRVRAVSEKDAISASAN